MKNHLEIEFKTLLTKSEYKRLLTDFSDVSPILQTNHYIDTPDLDMKNHRFSLRIRTFENSAELTLKIPQEVGNQEYNQVLDIQTAHDLLENFQLPAGQISDIISATEIPLDKLAVWGSLTTKRYEKQTSIGLMALDENDYVGQKDYELEVEVIDADAGKILFDEFLKKKSIQFKYASSKVARTAAHMK
ncbi:TPA: CYTH domain-containing protein [Streptococcus suis]|nr:CYTH domain-containing protein [Streptococcus suis]HEM6105546.1 CYTH domain-containing protein [Streptococcus suis]HEM6107220.1 CYTH domain-containing protein [Streptococcus suis]HEM6114274.1 CYTH domain-containing protein [Streptococcus suis]